MYWYSNIWVYLILIINIMLSRLGVSLCIGFPEQPPSHNWYDNQGELSEESAND